MPTVKCQRFWYTAETTPNLSDEGFLCDPEGEYGKYLNPALRPLQDFSTERLLFLLGEPGSGKSTDLQREHKRAAAQDESRCLPVYVDLATIGSDYQLKLVFQSTRIQEWMRSNDELTLFLDSLDESLLNVPVTVPLLRSEIRQLPVERLKIRITCRSAELPSSVPELFGNEFRTEAKVLYLAPLRRSDVADAAKVFGLANAESFIDEVVRHSVVPFAINPVTLRFLLGTYKQSGAFPPRRRDLFIQGLRELCRDPHDDMRLSPQETERRRDEKLAIASRIAAICVFSNRIAVGSDGNTTTVAMEEISGGAERIGNFELPVTPATIEASLKTALFGSLGRWAHRTYCEFLAASYISQHDVPIRTTLSLLVHPLDPKGHITPQLHETAAWLASFSKPVFDYILTVAPELLIVTPRSCCAMAYSMP